MLAVILPYWVRATKAAFRNRPKLAKEEILYQERSASGASQRNILTKLGGANNCLRLVVTKEILWITTWLPLVPLTAFYDLEHFIPLRNITSIESKKVFWKPALLLTFLDLYGVKHAVLLAPKKREAFLQALGRSADR